MSKAPEPKKAKTEAPECPVCFEFPWDPRVLITCGHTLCGACAKRLYGTPCPLCRRTSQLIIPNMKMRWKMEADWPEQWKKAHDAAVEKLHEAALADVRERWGTLDIHSTKELSLGEKVRVVGWLSEYHTYPMEEVKKVLASSVWKEAVGIVVCEGASDPEALVAKDREMVRVRLGRRVYLAFL